ncbi:hypothetical protein BH11PAT3_BH11PAT3_3130 [soil metagenome]
MKNPKRIIALTIVAIALLVLGHTIYGSVFYAANEGASIVDVNDGGVVPLAAVVEAGASISTGNVSVSTATTSIAKPVVTVKTVPSTRTSTSTPPASTLPKRLIIPSLNIDANVQYVTINAKGNMGTPNNFTDVSWYKPGTEPGKVGSAVMAGHVDNGLSLAGVFKKLDTIQVGDDVFVQQASGAKLHFKVEKVTSYPYTEVPVVSIFTSQDGSKRLNLITCVGAWVPGQKTYDRRLVVYTKLVE